MNTDSVTNDDEEYTGFFLTPSFGEEDQSDDFSVDDVTEQSSSDDDVINDVDDVIATDEEYSHKKFSKMFTVVGDDSEEFPVWAEEAIWEDNQNYDEEEFLTGWG